jgi:hypothetical protein
METQTFDAGALDETYWQPCSRREFRAAWQAEIDALPPFTDSTFHIMTGLLLPLWKRLPVKNPRIYRFVTDDGERVIGRLIPAETAGSLTGEVMTFSLDDAWAWIGSGAALTLEDGLTVKKRLVMHVNRFEVTGYSDTHVAWLKAQGCIGEIMGYRLRLFVPTGEQGPAVLERIMARYPHRPATALEREHVQAEGGLQ